MGVNQASFPQCVALLRTVMGCTWFLLRSGPCRVLEATWTAPLPLQLQERGTWCAASLLSCCWEGLAAHCVCWGWQHWSIIALNRPTVTSIQLLLSEGRQCQEATPTVLFQATFSKTEQQWESRWVDWEELAGGEGVTTKGHFGRWWNFCILLVVGGHCMYQNS